MLTVSLLPGLFEPSPVKTDVVSGADGFAPLIAGLLGPDAKLPDCTALPPGGEIVPVEPTGGAAPAPALALAPAIMIADDMPGAPSRFVPTGVEVVSDAMPPDVSPLSPSPKTPVPFAAGEIERPTVLPSLVVATADNAAPKPLAPVTARVAVLARPDEGSVVTARRKPAPAPADAGDEDTPAADDPTVTATPDGSALLVAVVPSAMTLLTPAPIHDTSATDVIVSSRHSGPSDAARGVAQDGLEPASRVVSAPANAPSVDKAIAVAQSPVTLTPSLVLTKGSVNPVQDRRDGGEMVDQTIMVATQVAAETMTRRVAPRAIEPPTNETPAGLARIVAAAPAPAVTPVILPALQAFGAAMRQALADARKPARIGTEAAADITGIAAAMTSAAPPPTVAGTALDTADRRWPHAMAEQIERLRDAADAQSTRIRLLPDALGPVDVSVRREGDQVHVHFTAAQAETRQLLADAQPRLADAAEARGLKLGRTDVSNSGLPGEQRGMGDRQQRAPTQHQTSQRPRAAAARATVADASDTRIA